MSSNRFENINGWMIGRGAVTNPFLPAIIKAGRDDINHKVEKFRQFYEELFEQYRQDFLRSRPFAEQDERLLDLLFKVISKQPQYR